jgi:hypothetical protein
VRLKVHVDVLFPGNLRTLLEHLSREVEILLLRSIHERRARQNGHAGDAGQLTEMHNPAKGLKVLAADVGIGMVERAVIEVRGKLREEIDAFQRVLIQKGVQVVGEFLWLGGHFVGFVAGFASLTEGGSHHTLEAHGVADRQRTFQRNRFKRIGTDRKP